MKKITIEINCGDEYCDKCVFCDKVYSVCERFEYVKLERDKKGNEFFRCKRCLESEVKDEKKIS